jgi:signal transduction histidine kinase
MKLKKRWPGKRIALYSGAIAISLIIAMVASWTAFAARIDNYAYDVFFNMFPPAHWTPQSAIVAIDEKTLQAMGGQRAYRGMLSTALSLIASAQPGAVAIDMILADPVDAVEDARLETAMRATRNLVLSCELVGGAWEDPLPRFRAAAAAVGQVHPERDKYDGVSRIIPLEQTAPGDRRWALSLEAFRVAHGGGAIVESPEDLEVAGVRIPAPRTGEQRPLRLRFLPGGIPTVTLLALEHNPALAAQFKGKVVFIGVTALSAARDRLVNPYGQDVPGVEIHADAFETMAQGQFLTPASDAFVLACCVLLAIAAGLTFVLRPGWTAYLLAALIVVAAHVLPAVLFRSGIVFPYSAAFSTAWLSVATAATFQYFSTRRELRQSESDKARYQQAIHFVTHEMRTPLTAIQGSSELMGRYNLTDDKRKQMALMINSESKRLARMIQTFLDVERLSEGQMDMKREPFASGEVIESCIDRVRSLAERKQIRLFIDALADQPVAGDRELMEYAVYNLLTNAVKYSPPDTEVHIESMRDGGHLRVSVRDQGIGIDAKELRNIFRKFYRTRKAEASGEAGTGIGLSIVEQIVVNHGGRMEVASTPGKGSTFTIIVPAGIAASAK